MRLRVRLWCTWLICMYSLSVLTLVVGDIRESEPVKNTCAICTQRISSGKSGEREPTRQFKLNWKMTIRMHNAYYDMHYALKQTTHQQLVLETWQANWRFPWPDATRKTSQDGLVAWSHLIVLVTDVMQLGAGSEWVALTRLAHEEPSTDWHRLRAVLVYTYNARHRIKGMEIKDTYHTKKQNILQIVVFV